MGMVDPVLESLYRVALADLELHQGGGQASLTHRPFPRRERVAPAVEGPSIPERRERVGAVSGERVVVAVVPQHGKCDLEHLHHPFDVLSHGPARAPGGSLRRVVSSASRTWRSHASAAALSRPATNRRSLARGW